ncbi:MAG: family 20 glycosylhydrolase [Phycisphaerae bacterium]|nr:family 20 glycosylhydrolase [Phycisphaerae bacterium]
MKKLILVMAMMIMASGCATRQIDIDVIPKPMELQVVQGVFELDRNMVIYVQAEDQRALNCAGRLAVTLRGACGYGVDVVFDVNAQANADIIMIVDSESELGAEGYTLDINKDEIKIVATEAAGLFYGSQSIEQMLTVVGNKAVLPCVSIKDEPRFVWRGMLLDCGRHFMDKEFVKRYIDLLAYYKMNRLHWHLTEDQGWRIEIKKYPNLTKIGAWRKYEDGTTYGGFYSQEDVKEIVEYARQRFVTVVPEIEMPGHSVAALAAYPQLSCTGGPFEVETAWGVHEDVYCAGNEKTFAFLEDVLDEVCELFPSVYIHIGGDECPKVRWEKCPRCQKRIKDEGLKDEHELQSYFIKRMEKYLEGKGRHIIGWDEILEGGLAPGATVQSWRGMEGAIAAAKSGHDAIVSPVSHAYFDYHITKADLYHVYGFEPVPAELTEDEAKHIIGAECNVWTEHIPQDRVDYMVFPRILAMCEVMWSPKAGRDYNEFYQRVSAHYKKLDSMGVKYGPEAEPVAIEAKRDENGRFAVTLKGKGGETGLDFMYTIDGSDINDHSLKYAGPFEISESCVIKAQAIKNGRTYGNQVQKPIDIHKACGKMITIKNAPSDQYPGSGPGGLVDGLLGDPHLLKESYWQGFQMDDFEAVIDLGQSQKINRIAANFLRSHNSWIFMPKRVNYAVSVDGQEFAEVAAKDFPPRDKDQSTEAVMYDVKINEIEARYIKVVAKNVGICPDWHKGKGGNAWLFIDEIIVE